MSDRTPRHASLDTIAVHGGEPRPLPAGSVAMPLYPSSTYLLDEGASYDDIRYVRLNNTPNHDATAAKIAALEGTEAAVLAASGMAAITTTLLAHLSQGDHVLAQDCLYGGTRSFLDRDAPRLGITTTYVSLEDPDAWRGALRPTTRIFYLESVTNPLLQVGRLDEAAAFAREHGLVSLIDNTFPSPAGFRPASLGFDVVLHSATKSLGGHSDLGAGAACGSRERVERIRHQLNHLGGCLDPRAAWLLHRGLKTLALRSRAQAANALALATALRAHPAVETVAYPWLEGDASFDRARRWFASGGGMVSFVPRGGAAAAARFLGRVRLAQHAPSLGGTETLVILPSASSHAGQSAESRAAMGIREELVRVSCGIEGSEDLVADFEQALGG